MSELSGTFRVFALYVIFPDRRNLQLRVASNAGTCTLLRILLFKQSDHQMQSYVRGSAERSEYLLYILFSQTDSINNYG